jgi:hypothetical protein
MKALFFLLVTAMVSPAFAQHQRGSQAKPSPVTSDATDTRPAPPGPLPPLPFDGYPAPRPMAVVQAAYEFAARHPEVLKFVPCFCACEKHGHRGNHDCFVKSRDPSGRPTWDSHGYG